MGVSTPPARIIAELSKGDITEDRTVESAKFYLMANSDRLSHFGHRMSHFLQTLALRGILFSEQEHRREHMKCRVETCSRRYEQHESLNKVT